MHSSLFPWSKPCGIHQWGTGEYCWVQVTWNSIAIDFTGEKVHKLLLKVKSWTLNALWVWHICNFQLFGDRYRLLPQIESWARWQIGRKTIVTFCLHKFLVSHLMHWYILREGLNMASLLVGMTRNDVMVNIRGGATCNNNKQFKHVPLAKSLFKFCNDTAP